MLEMLIIILNYYCAVISKSCIVESKWKKVIWQVNYD